ncbi:hypothetical protein SCP_0905400 [Sparassis crispa]|uniref:Uncharacterized protein n=1 Tax=Sparassis crispa TaxID=139825 RepID=A0A401GWU4_9APHY|nr:hypothetical protein SCP_0905400 [Sparassis crispa]GBE86660.1 hypothetical protein SCP_0905400 [Sparassis crispa]
MPRGIPNAKKDESAMRFTSFHVPLGLAASNAKHPNSGYLKTESQALWYRNSKKRADDTGSATPTEVRRGSRVLVIHLGSRYVRVGRASDVNPVTIPNVIARKHTRPVLAPKYVEGISRPRAAARAHAAATPPNGDEYSVSLTSDDPFDLKVAAITVSLRDRMRFYKLRVTPNAAGIASTFNEQFVPEIIPESNDPFLIDWIKEPIEDVLVGDKALQLADPASAGYVIKWPIYGGNFNTRDYPSIEGALDDIETILRAAFKRLNIEPHAYHDYSVVLVIPDYYDRFYVQALVRMLLVSMGFKQLCAQQESLAATYGAGISNACVVDMGAVTTSIACVDDGLVLAGTRMSLNMGGDDISEFLYVLLERISFPYREIDLARWYDWSVIEDLKARLCTLAEGDVALNLYDFVVRRPGKPTEKYGLRAYDEIILAPMCLFEPRVIEFEQKRTGMRPTSHKDITDNLSEQVNDHVAHHHVAPHHVAHRYPYAMVISTQHLTLQTPYLPPPEIPSMPHSGPQTPAPGELPSAVMSPHPVQGDAAAAVENSSPPREVKEEVQQPTITTTATIGEGTADVPMEILDDEIDSKASVPSPAPTPVEPPQPVRPPQTLPGESSIDVCFEASKLPLDVAIFNSARAAGGDEKIRRYLQAVLVIGGTALVPGMAHALESRLQAIATPLVPNMEKVQIIPPPKDVDPRVLAWKGAAVLGKMDGVADLWITGADWDILGMRGLKERCFYL